MGTRHITLQSFQALLSALLAVCLGLTSLELVRYKLINFAFIVLSWQQYFVLYHHLGCCAYNWRITPIDLIKDFACICWPLD